MAIVCSNAGEVGSTDAPKERTITYLNKEYTVPAKVTRIATASMESMEDAAVLGVKPVGAITIAGKLPEYVAKELEDAKSIGEKMQPTMKHFLA